MYSYPVDSLTSLCPPTSETKPVPWAMLHKMTIFSQHCGKSPQVYTETIWVFLPAVKHSGVKHQYIRRY